MSIYSVFFIIFGTRGITYTKESGEFHCPDCEARSFRHRRVRRFFTLYFIPLIPLDLLGEFVECDNCKATWDLGVLDYDPGAEGAAFEATYFTAMKNTMILMMLADGVIDDDELQVISSITEGLTDTPFSPEAVRQQASRLKAGGQSVTDFLGEVGPMLNDSGREMVMQAAFAVAMADDEFEDSEREMLMDIANALEMTPAHARGMLAELMDAHTHGADGQA